MSEIPQKIGPYRVLQKLGAGGMGEVFLAHDERLDRRVAIKRIRPDAGISPERRERFHREAQMAARLSHPAIIQVHDILEDGDLDYIVMEFVDGTSLRDLAGAGPLPVHRSLELARELADGLDAAHREGIVHRDFKSENVLITPSGRPKITDFGIAKRLFAQDRAEESLTGDHTILGTCRSMSPEQARGEPVDHRTDLFAFGVLLYEILAGSSPFAGDSSLATLNRVIHQRQKPLAEVNPEVPEPLSRLVDHLLEKDPLLRPRSAGEVRRELERLAFSTRDRAGTETSVEPIPRPPSAAVQPLEPEGVALSAGRQTWQTSFSTLRRRPLAAVVVLLALLALGGLAGRFVFRPAREPLSVAVLPSQISDPAAAGELNLLAAGVDTALLRGLTSLEDVSPRDVREIGPGIVSPVTAARAAAADEVVSTRLDCRPDACRVSLRRLRGSDGTTLWAESFDVPTDDFHLVANAVTAQIQRGYGDHAVREGTPALDVTSEDLKTFLQLRERFLSGRDVDLGPILEELAKVRGASPRFLDVYLLEADVARHRFYDSRDPADLDRAFELIRRARKLAPNDPQPLFVLFDAALAARRLDEAGEALAELKELVPGDVKTQDKQAFLLREQGQADRALAVLRSAARRSPSWRRLVNLARLEYQNGNIAEARAHLEHLLKISPGNFEGLSLLAQIELTNGSPEQAARLYEEIVQKSPTLSELSNLGLAYFLLGRYSAAAARFRTVVTQEPRNPFYTLNLADAYFLMGNRAEANELYRKVLDLIAADPTATGPQFLTVKGQALAHLGEGLRAVEAVQEASSLAPNDASVAYETSLVYALLGDDDSALFNAKKSLRLGYEPRWFTFPWFQPLSQNPEFRTLLEEHTTKQER